MLRLWLSHSFWVTLTKEVDDVTAAPSFILSKVAKAVCIEFYEKQPCTFKSYLVQHGNHFIQRVITAVFVFLFWTTVTNSRLQNNTTPKAKDFKVIASIFYSHVLLTLVEGRDVKLLFLPANLWTYTAWGLKIHLFWQLVRCFNHRLSSVVCCH